MPKLQKKMEYYMKKDDFFIFEKTMKSSMGNNDYWFVFFPLHFKIPSKSFNKKLYKKDDAIKYRNFWVEKHLKEIYI